MRAAALVGLSGADPREFLFTHDPDRAVVLQAVGEEADRLRAAERDDLAHKTVNALGKAMKKGS